MTIFRSYDSKTYSQPEMKSAKTAQMTRLLWEAYLFQFNKLNGDTIKYSFPDDFKNMVVLAESVAVKIQQQSWKLEQVISVAFFEVLKEVEGGESEVLYSKTLRFILDSGFHKLLK